jgi:hypothetical protein
LKYAIAAQEKEVMLNATQITRKINVDLWTVHLQKSFGDKFLGGKIDSSRDIEDHGTRRPL